MEEVRMASYTASKSLPPGRKIWVVSFRHPLRKDSKGKLGLKVRRSLETPDEIKAEQLCVQMNELLADESLHNVLERQRAEKAGVDPIVVAAFYDCLEASNDDPARIRDKEIAIPKTGVPSVLLAGVTGSGKTSLLRQLIGSDPKTDRFPSTSTARTTTCDIEVIVATGSSSYKAVVTFRSQWETIASVAECVSNACLAAVYDWPERKIADRLLHHSDQIFRLNYVLGSYSAETSSGDEWNYEGEDDPETQEPNSDETSISVEQRAEMQSVLVGFLGRIKLLAKNAQEKTERDLEISFGGLSSADKDIAEEYFAEVLENLTQFDELIDDILDQILARFDHLPVGERVNRPGGWPESWTCECDAGNREDFIPRVRWFSSNYAGAFGRLVTPLVQGIRVRGPFHPRFTSDVTDIVLIDGQGFGHTPESSASVSTQVTKRYAAVDAILLVDNAAQSMLPASLSILRSVLASGYQRKLAIAFTHVDQVVGPNLPDFASKQTHVMNAAAGALRSLHEVLGASLVETLERQLDNRCFMLGWLNRPISEKSKGPVHEMEILLSFCRDSILPEPPTEAVPVYDPTGLLIVALSADTQFQELWKARLGYIELANVQRKHWATVKALNRRVAQSFGNSEYSDLRPVAELVARLSESIGKFLDKPSRWHGPSDAAQRQAAIDKVRQRVFGALHALVEDRLLRAPFAEWVRAYDLSGRYSTSSRAGAIKDIVEEAAPIPHEAMSREASAFLNELRGLIRTAIKDAGGMLELADDILAGCK
jgi:hypothetical protein